MIIADTSVWIDHLRTAEPALEGLLRRERILIHPFVTGELALGSLQKYDAVIEALLEMPQATVATPEEVLFTIKRYSLMASGIGYVDTHILTAAKLVPGTLIWTRDKRLARVAATLGLGYEP
jgi:predicted nucleic acid-binding protein